MNIQEAASTLMENSAYANPDLVNELLARLRKEAPICYVEKEGYKPVWLVTRHEDIKFVEGNPDRFLAGPRTVITPADVDPSERTRTSLIGMDGDQHRTYRQLTQSWFMPRNLRNLEDAINGHAKKYVDLMASHAPNCDFAKDVAFWYPLRVVLSLLEVPEEDDPQIIAWTQKLFGFEDESLDGETTSQEEISLKFFEYFAPIVEARRANPGSDLASTLATAEIDGEPIGLVEMLGYFLIVATAGHDTTSASLAGGLRKLIENPEQLKVLQEDPSGIPAAVEEMIRWVAPVKHFARTAVEDIEVGGQKIPKGDNLMLLFASAARDEEIFPDGDQFNIARSPNNHMAFGFGAHMCLGRYLAKMELEAFFRELLPRLKHIELAGASTTLASNLVSGPISMPIRFEMIKRVDSKN